MTRGEPRPLAVRLESTSRGRADGARARTAWAGRATDRTDEPTVPAADAVRPIICESSRGTT